MMSRQSCWGGGVDGAVVAGGALVVGVAGGVVAVEPEVDPLSAVVVPVVLDGAGGAVVVVGTGRVDPEYVTGWPEGITVVGIDVMLSVPAWVLRGAGRAVEWCCCGATCVGAAVGAAWSLGALTDVLSVWSAVGACGSAAAVVEPFLPEWPCIDATVTPPPNSATAVAAAARRRFFFQRAIWRRRAARPRCSVGASDGGPSTDGVSDPGNSSSGSAGSAAAKPGADASGAAGPPSAACPWPPAGANPSSTRPGWA